MCLAVPCRVIEVDGLFATVARGDATLAVSLALLEEQPAPGSWVAVQAQRYAVACLSDEDAALALAMFAQIAELPDSELATKIGSLV
jgi:hydrogenase assembly chaperone HypC/HupF